MRYIRGPFTWKEAPMPLFILSMNWTEQGIRTIKDWPKRLG
jgi:uncharacterized protein with GYD domain